MWGAWIAFRAGRGWWRWYQGFRARDRAAHEAEGIDNGPWTAGAVAFTLFPMALIGAGVATAQGSRWAWAWWLAAGALFAVPALGGVRRRAGNLRVLERYAAAPVRDEAGLMREQAALLREHEELVRRVTGQPADTESPTEPLPQAAVTEPLPAVRDDLTERLFSEPCPEPSCTAQPPHACPMGIGVPVALVNRSPVEFCHLTRIAAGVEAGTVTQEEVSARFRQVITK